MDRYLQQETLYPPFIGRRPSQNLEYVVVIPAIRESTVLLNLRRLQQCQLPIGDGEVILLLNQPRQADAVTRSSNQQVYLQILEWSQKKVNPRLRFYVHWLEDLPMSRPGPGLARKIGMDEACYRLAKARNRRGWILVLDADVRIEKDFLLHLYRQSQSYPRDILLPNIPYQLRGIDQPDELYRAAARAELLNWYQKHLLGMEHPAANGAIWIPKNVYQKLPGLRSFEDSTWQRFLQRAQAAQVNVRRLPEIGGLRVPRGEGRCADGDGVNLQAILQNKKDANRIKSCLSGRNMPIEEAILEALPSLGVENLPNDGDPVQLMLFCRLLSPVIQRAK